MLNTSPPRMLNTLSATSARIYELNSRDWDDSTRGDPDLQDFTFAGLTNLTYTVGTTNFYWLTSTRRNRSNSRLPHPN